MYVYNTWFISHSNSFAGIPYDVIHGAQVTFIVIQCNCQCSMLSLFPKLFVILGTLYVICQTEGQLTLNDDRSFHVYPRPVLAFRYCRCLRLSVCVCVLPCVNHELVRAITHHPFQLGSPNLDHRFKRPWLRPLLFFFLEWLTLTFKVKFNFKVKIYPILSLSMR